MSYLTRVSREVTTRRRALARKKSISRNSRRVLHRSNSWKATPYSARCLNERLKYLQSSLAYSTDAEEQSRLQGEIDTVKNDLATASLY